MNFAREFAQLNLENLNTPIFQGIAVEIPFQQGAPLKQAKIKWINTQDKLKSPSSKGHR